MTRSLDDIDRAGRLISSATPDRNARARLVISCSPGVAELWLGARLGRFCRAYPDIEPEILVSADLKQLLAGHADLAIHWGAGSWPQLAQEELHAPLEFPVCSPALLRGQVPLADVDDLRHHRLLHWQSRGWWGAWLRDFQVTDIDWNQGPVLHDYALALDMAVAGEGVALADDLLAGEHLLTGRLVKPLAAAREPEYRQQLLMRPDPDRPDAVAAFRDWLQNEIGQHRRSTRALREPAPFTAVP